MPISMTIVLSWRVYGTTTPTSEVIIALKYTMMTRMMYGNYKPSL